MTPSNGNFPFLGSKTCTELHADLKQLGKRMEGIWSSDDARRFCIEAWHLYQDWLPSDQKNRPQHAVLKMDKTKLPQEMKLVLDVLRDIANSSKHFELNPTSQKKQVITGQHDCQTNGWYAWFFLERIPGVSAGLYNFSIRKLRDFSLEYFAWVFDDSQSPNVFPGELLGKIWYSAPANRDSSATSPPGAILPKADPGFVR